MPDADPNRIVHCIKLGKDLPGLAKPPFPSELGKMIFERVSKEAWDQWLKESPRYINTSGLELGTREGTQELIRIMRIWLGFDEGQLPGTNWSAPKSHDHSG